MAETSAADARAELVRRRMSGGRHAGRARLSAGERPERPVLSFAQYRLWFIDRLQPGNIAYTIPAAYWLRGSLDVTSIERALATVVERHESLRTRFPVVEGEPYQLIEPLDFTLPVDDLTGHEDPECSARAAARAEALRPFDLAGDPLFRARLLRLDARDHVLLVTVHHAVFDGWSLGVFAAEVSEAYVAFLKGAAPELGTLPLQYADFAAWQRRQLTGELVAGHLAYWLDQLSGAPLVLNLPTDRPHPEESSHRGHPVRFSVSADVVRGLRRVANDRKTSLFVVTLAAYHVLLARHAGVTDILVGVSVSGRPHAELEGLIGLFVDSLPLRADLANDPPFRDLVDQIRETALDAFSHQDVLFEQLVEKLAPARDLSRNPVVQAWFNLLATDGKSPGALTLPGIKTEAFDSGEVTTRFDIELHLLHAGGDKLSGQLIYSADLFDRTTMEWFTRRYVKFLTEVARDPGQLVSRVPIALPEELDLISGWNNPATTDRPPRPWSCLARDN